MKAMKILSILAIIFSFTQCGSAKFEANPPFNIDSAEYHGWVGGIPGASGINVKIQLAENSSVEFDSLYFRNKSTKIKSKEGFVLIANINTSKSNASDIIIDSDSKKELNNKIPKPDIIPFELKANEAVISYKIKGEIKYFKILNMKELDTSSNPKIR